MKTKQRRDSYRPVFLTLTLEDANRQPTLILAGKMGEGERGVCVGVGVWCVWGLCVCV